MGCAQRNAGRRRRRCRCRRCGSGGAIAGEHPSARAIGPGGRRRRRRSRRRRCRGRSGSGRRRCRSRIGDFQHRNDVAHRDRVVHLGPHFLQHAADDGFDFHRGLVGFNLDNRSPASTCWPGWINHRITRISDSVVARSGIFISNRMSFSFWGCSRRLEGLRCVGQARPPNRQNLEWVTSKGFLSMKNWADFASKTPSVVPMAVVADPPRAAA